MSTPSLPPPCDLQVCRAYADSDSPFSAVDVDSVVDAFRDGFSREATSGELGWMALHKLLPAIRNFVPGCAYERELCEILGRMYRAADDVHLNASKLLEDFSSILSARSQPPSRGDRRTTLSKVDLRHAITSWITEGVSKPTLSPAVHFAHTSPPRQQSPARSSKSRDRSPPTKSVDSPPPSRSAPSPPLEPFHPAKHASSAHSSQRRKSRSPSAERRTSPPHPTLPTLSSQRAAAGALTALVAQAEQAARKNERSFDEAEEVISSWHERVSSAEHEAYVSAREVERVRGEYARVQSEMASLSRRNHALEER